MGIYHLPGFVYKSVSYLFFICGYRILNGMPGAKGKTV